LDALDAPALKRIKPYTPCGIRWSIWPISVM
jgi:hypothetical protein